MPFPGERFNGDVYPCGHLVHLHLPWERVAPAAQKNALNDLMYLSLGARGSCRAEKRIKTCHQKLSTESAAYIQRDSGSRAF